MPDRKLGSVWNWRQMGIDVFSKPCNPMSGRPMGTAHLTRRAVEEVPIGALADDHRRSVAGYDADGEERR